MTRPSDLPPAGLPPRPARPAQPAGAVIARLLLSLALIGGAAVGFRFSLAPASAPAQAAGTRSLQQAEVLAGARSARLTLGADWVDLNLGVAELPGQALRGQATLPSGATVARAARCEGDLLAASYTERSRALNLGGLVRLRLGADGLNLLDHAAGAQLGVWNVKLARGLPTDLRLNLGSGDANLALTQATLTHLELSSASGNLNADLPLKMAGDVRVKTLSGDIQVSRNGPGAAGGPASALEAETGSGQVRLSLAGSAFSRVRVSSSSGDQSVTLPARPDVAATLRTSSGDLRLTVPAGLVSGDLNLTSLSGDLRLRLPPGAAVRLNVTTGSGDVQVPAGYLRRDTTYLSRAALNGGPTLNLNVTTGSGNVTVTEDPR